MIDFGLSISTIKIDDLAVEEALSSAPHPHGMHFFLDTKKQPPRRKHMKRYLNVWQ